MDCDRDDAVAALVNVWSTHECVPLRTLIRPNPVRSVESSQKRRHFKGLPVILLKSKGSKVSEDSAHNLKVVGSNPTPATKFYTFPNARTPPSRAACAFEPTMEARAQQSLAVPSERIAQRPVAFERKAREVS